MTTSTEHMDRALHSAGQDVAGTNARSVGEFARARRHSRLVSVLKVGLPILAVLIVAGGIGVTWLARSLPDNVSLAGATLDNGRIVMQDPRLSGYDKSQRPYSMVADRAIQAITGGGVELEGVRANVTVGADSTADIVAARGHYDPDSQKLRLFDSINVKTTDGMSIKMSEAQIDLAGGNMTGTGPIDIATANQTIQAGALTVGDGGRTLSFGNGVKLMLLPSSTGRRAEVDAGGPTKSQ